MLGTSASTAITGTAANLDPFMTTPFTEAFVLMSEMFSVSAAERC
jgi:hypothetical protein